MKQLCILILINSTLLFPAPIDNINSLKVAKNIFIEYSGQAIGEFEINNVEMIEVDNIDLLYIYHILPNGFILVSADDRSWPYLGYSFNNNFTLDNMPNNINWVFETYKDNILQKIINNSIQTNEILLEWDKYLSNGINQSRERNVEPLINAQFDQSGAWNNALSEFGFYGPVGCVAVSMSQIMHYWHYPTQGQGSNIYQEDDFGILFVDFSQAYYDFNNMAATWPAPQKLYQVLS